MQRDPDRVPASRRSARIGFALKLALGLLVGVPLVVSFACSSGSPPDGSEPTGRVQQAVTPAFGITAIAPMTSGSGGAPQWKAANGFVAYPGCISTSKEAAAQCQVDAQTVSDNASGVQPDDVLVGPDWAIDEYSFGGFGISFTTPCSTQEGFAYLDYTRLECGTFFASATNGCEVNWVRLFSGSIEHQRDRSLDPLEARLGCGQWVWDLRVGVV